VIRTEKTIGWRDSAFPHCGSFGETSGIIVARRSGCLAAYREDERTITVPIWSSRLHSVFAETSRRDKAVFGFNSKPEKLFLPPSSPSTPKF